MNIPSAQAAVLLEWAYSPRDFFESPIEIARSDYPIDIASGTISAKLPASTFDADAQMKRRLHDSLFDRMRGVQLLTRKPFELSKPRLTRIEPDGRRHIYVELEGAVLTFIGGSVDFTITNANGKVVRDTKQERIGKKQELAELIAKYSPGDSTLGAMLKSYATSTSDANNELVHLYEVRESLSVAFHGESKARGALSISRANWSSLGQLCNDEPLRQGRHRGKSLGVLRDATETELSEARNISRLMIEAYLLFRDSGGAVQ